MSKHRTPFEDLPLIPLLIAETVAMRPYTGEELSVRIRAMSEVKEIEALRQKMTVEQVNEFAQLCEQRCKDAYEAKTDWFERCLPKGRTNRGRDQLYMWISHWLGAYLRNPERFRKYASFATSNALEEAVPKSILGKV